MNNTMGRCEAFASSKSYWSYCPNTGADYLFIVLFGITTIAHFVQMFLHKKPYSWVIFASGLLQLAAFVTRLMSIYQPLNHTYFTIWFLLILVAPIWTNAFVYMVMGRMVYNFTPTASVFKIKAWRFGLIFVTLDIIAFYVQLTGAAMASGNDSSSTRRGLDIYMGGIGLQQACIFLFLTLAIRFHQKLRQENTSSEHKNAFTLLYVEYAVVFLITVRIIFRLVEYSSPDSTIARHEAYEYVFDTLVMFIALVLFNIFHPGRLMPGAESNLPSRKVRKNLKRQGQQAHGRLWRGEENLLPKYEPNRVDAADDNSVSGYEGTGYEGAAYTEAGYGDTTRGQYAQVPSPNLAPEIRYDPAH